MLESREQEKSRVVKCLKKGKVVSFSSQKQQAVVEFSPNNRLFAIRSREGNVSSTSNKISRTFLSVTHIMNFLSRFLFLPLINALVTVQIYRSSWYRPGSPCAFIRNVSSSTDASIQSCIWTCVHEYNCQTATYFDQNRTCSMFTEFYRTGSVQPSSGVQASVICYRKEHGRFGLYEEIEEILI